MKDSPFKPSLHINQIYRKFTYALIIPGKPHVSSLTFQSVINLKTQLERGLLLLDLQLADMSQILKTLVEQLIETGMLEKEQKNKGTSMFDRSI